MTALVVGVGLGVIVGFVAGRRWAETSRARYDMRQAWQGRKRYRR